LPRYAFGAIPETRTRPRGPVATVLLSPAAIPATWVACSEYSGSNGRLAYFQVVDGDGKARATITFGVVNAVFPLGKPAG